MLAMMVDLEDDEDWSNADELDDDDFDRYTSMRLWNFVVGRFRNVTIYFFLS